MQCSVVKRCAVCCGEQYTVTVQLGAVRSVLAASSGLARNLGVIIPTAVLLESERAPTRPDRSIAECISGSLPGRL